MQSHVLVMERGNGHIILHTGWQIHIDGTRNLGVGGSSL